MTTEEMLQWLQENAEKISPENKAVLLAAGIKISGDDSNGILPKN